MPGKISPFFSSVQYNNEDELLDAGYRPLAEVINELLGSPLQAHRDQLRALGHNRVVCNSNKYGRDRFGWNGDFVPAKTRYRRLMRNFLNEYRVFWTEEEFSDGLNENFHGVTGALRTEYLHFAKIATHRVKRGFDNQGGAGSKQSSYIYYYQGSSMYEARTRTTNLITSFTGKFFDLVAEAFSPRSADVFRRYLSNLGITNLSSVDEINSRPIPNGIEIGAYHNQAWLSLYTVFYIDVPFHDAIGIDDDNFFTPAFLQELESARVEKVIGLNSEEGANLPHELLPEHVIRLSEDRELTYPISNQIRAQRIVSKTDNNNLLAILGPHVKQRNYIGVPHSSDPSMSPILESIKIMFERLLSVHTGSAKPCYSDAVDFNVLGAENRVLPTHSTLFQNCDVDVVREHLRKRCLQELLQDCYAQIALRVRQGQADLDDERAVT